VPARAAPGIGGSYPREKKKL
jgi:hypothetical protein